jgi:hypothetical protein
VVRDTAAAAEGGRRARNNWYQGSRPPVIEEAKEAQASHCTSSYWAHRLQLLWAITRACLGVAVARISPVCRAGRNQRPGSTVAGG